MKDTHVFFLSPHSLFLWCVSTLYRILLFFLFLYHFLQNYSSFDSLEPAKVILEKDHKSVDPALMSEIDRTMKKYADNLMHALDGISARLTQLESRTRHFENSVDDLKVSVGNNFGSSDGKMRQLENILREVSSFFHLQVFVFSVIIHYVLPLITFRCPHFHNCT